MVYGLGSVLHVYNLSSQKPVMDQHCVEFNQFLTLEVDNKPIGQMGLENVHI